MKLLYFCDENPNKGSLVEYNFVAGFKFKLRGDELTLDSGQDLPPQFFSLRDLPAETQIRDACCMSESVVESISAIIGRNGTGKTNMARCLSGCFNSYVPVRQWMLISVNDTSVGIYGSMKDVEIGSVEKRLRENELEVKDFRRVGKTVEMPYEFIYYTPFCAPEKVMPNGVEHVYDLSPADFFSKKESKTLGVLTAPDTAIKDYSTSLAKYEQRLQEEMVFFLHDCYANGLDGTEHGSFALPRRAIISDDRMLMLELKKKFKEEVERWLKGSVRGREYSYKLGMGFANAFVTLPAMCFAILDVLLLVLDEKRRGMQRRDQLDCGLEQFAHSCFMAVENAISAGKQSQKYDPKIHDDRGKIWWRILTEEQKEACYREISNSLDELARDGRACKLIKWDQLSIVWKCIVKIATRYQGEVDDDMLLCSFEHREEYENFVELMVAYSKLELQRPFLRIMMDGMSSGEMAYLSMFARLHYCIKNLKYVRRVGNNVRKDPLHLLLFLDEAETTMHPEWQRQLVSNIIWYIEGFTSNVRAHVIFASHSPLLLSDIPSSNVVYLDDPPRDGRDRLRNTFGSNIYDLFRLSFGMSRGVLGGLADKKLELLLQRKKENGKLDGDDLKLAELFGDELIHEFLLRRK